MLEVGLSANSMTPNQLRVTFGQLEAMSYFMISVHCGHGINPISQGNCQLWTSYKFDPLSGKKGHQQQQPTAPLALDVDGAVCPLPVSNRQVNYLVIELGGVSEYLA